MILQACFQTRLTVGNSARQLNRMGMTT